MKFFYALQPRETPKKINKFVIAGVLFLMAITYYLATPALCKINAISVNDYCYKFTLGVNKTTTGQADPYTPVMLPSVDTMSWEANSYIDKFNWSIYPYQGSLATEYEAMLQDVNSLASNQWYVLPVIQPNNNQITVLLGSTDKQRNQGMYFFQEDYGLVPNHNDFNQSTFVLDVELQDLISSSSSTTHSLIDKYDELNDTGFKFEYLRNYFVGIDAIKCTVGDGATSYESVKTFIITNLNQNFNCTFASGILQTSVDGGVPSVDSGTMATNTEDVLVGANYDTASLINDDYLTTTVIRKINIGTGVFASGTYLSRAMFGFNPTNINQASASDPNYSGTVTDISESGTDHVYTYYFTRSQAGLIVEAGIIAEAGASGTTIFTRDMADVSGRWFGSSNPANKIVGNNNFFMNSFLAPPSNVNMPEDAWYSLWLSAFGLVFAFGVWWVFKSVPISLFGASVPLVIGAIQGMLAPEFVVIWFLAFLGIYSSFQWYERS